MKSQQESSSAMQGESQKYKDQVKDLQSKITELLTKKNSEATSLQSSSDA